MALTLADLITIVPVLQQNVTDLQAANVTLNAQVTALSTTSGQQSTDITAMQTTMNGHKSSINQLVLIANKMIIQQQPLTPLVPAIPVT
jgi:hypothetical protein